MKTTAMALSAILAASAFAAEPERKAPRPARPSQFATMRPMQQAKPKDFGKLADGRETRIWRLSGVGGLVVDVSDYGGRIVRVYAPDRHGNLADVALGWNTAAEYEKYGFSMGTLIGRYANRIKDGKFSLDGQEYTLPINEEKAARHCNLHGGPDGWDKKVWNARPFGRGTIRSIEFSCVSADGEMGFPGEVNCKVIYAVLPNNTLTITYEAKTDKPTVINLTHHGYWNLAGEASGSVLDQELMIAADEYTKTDAGLIPLANAPVKGTGFDFTSPRKIGAMADWMAKEPSLAPMNNWYDHNFFLRDNGKAKGKGVKLAAVMRDPVSGRKMEVWTTEPCMQMYGAQNMTDELPAKAAGKKLCKFAGVALETQHAPDSPNHPEFPSTVLRPGETFRSHTEYRFSAE